MPDNFDRVFGPQYAPLVVAIHIANSLEDTLVLARELVTISKEYLRQDSPSRSSLLLEQVLSSINADPRRVRAGPLPDSPLITRHTDLLMPGSPLIATTLLLAAQQFARLEEGENVLSALESALRELRLIPAGNERATITELYIDTALQVGDLAYEQVNAITQQVLLYPDTIKRIELLLYESTQLASNELSVAAEVLLQHALTASIGIEKEWDRFLVALLFRKYHNDIGVAEFLSSVIVEQFPALVVPQHPPTPTVVIQIGGLITESAPELWRAFLATIPDPRIKSLALVSMLETRPAPSLALRVLESLNTVLSENTTTTNRGAHAHRGALAAIRYGADRALASFLGIAGRGGASREVRLIRAIELTQAYRDAGRTSDAARSYQETRRYRGATNIPVALLVLWYQEILRTEGADQLLSDILFFGTTSQTIAGLVLFEQTGIAPTESQNTILRRIRNRY